MNTNIENPKILLLDCGLDYNRQPNGITNYEQLKTLEPAYFNIIMKKIEMIQPNCILVNKNVSRKLQESLSEKTNISLIMNVKSASLKNIARCTKTYVLPSTDLIDKQTILGTCKKFRIEKIKRKQNKQCAPSQHLFLSNEYNLMIFEGCDQILFSTIILSGPNKSELKLIKNLMRTILSSARDLYLQKYLIYFTYCDVPNINEIASEIILRHSINSSKNSSSQSILSQNNSSNLVLQHLATATSQLSSSKELLMLYGMKKNSNTSNTLNNINKFEQVDYMINKDLINGFDTSSITKQNNFVLTQLVIAEGDKTFTESNYYLEITEKDSPITSFKKDQNKIFKKNPNSKFIELSNSIDESFVLKSVNHICSEPQDIEMLFYSELNERDKSLGKLIIDLCSEADIKCLNPQKLCKKRKGSHNYYFNKKGGRIKIQTLNDTNDKLNYIEQVIQYINRESVDYQKYNLYTDNNKNMDSKGNINYNHDIFTYGVCKICQKIVTPLTKLPNELFNFSTARYFKFMLYNHQLKNRGNKREFNLSKQGLAFNECSHYVNKDINRIFVTNIGCIKFSYENIPLYIIETPLITERRENVKLISIEIQSSKLKILEVIELMKNNYKYFSEELNIRIPNLICKYSQIECPIFVDIYNSVLIDKINKIINKYSNVLNDISNFIENVSNLPTTFEDFHIVMNFIRRIYVRIVQIKIIHNNIWKILTKIKNLINEVQPFTPILQLNIKVQTHSDNSLPQSKEENKILLQDSKNSSPSISRLSVLKSKRQSNIIPTKGFVIENRTLDTTYNYINIDKNVEYNNIRKEIEYIDENHTQYSANIIEEDFSSFLAYALSSNQYRDFISPSNKFQLTNIKCERRSKSNNDYILNVLKEHHNEKVLEVHNTDMKYGYNIMTLKDEDQHDSSLLFDSNKNIFIYQNLDNNKIIQHLETELLSDEKNHFTYVISNNNVLNYLKTSNLPIEYYPILKKPERSNTSNMTQFHIKLSKEKSLQEFFKSEDKEKIHQVNSVPDLCFNGDNVEKLILQGDNIKSTLEEIEAIKKEIKIIKNNHLITKNKSFKYEFIEDILPPSISHEITVYYPRQFEALRIAYCSTYEDFLLTISKSEPWSNVSGGKSTADFFKTHDNKVVLKYVSKDEFKMFIETAFQHFHHTAKFLFHKMPSCLAKALGAYKIKSKSKERINNYYIIMMENLFYGKEELDKTKRIKAYDLKGSEMNRYLNKKECTGRVLLDTNFKEDFKGEPLLLDRYSCDLLKAALHNDSLLLSKLNVIDYSLLLIIEDSLSDGNKNNDNNAILIRVGIIDFIRKYTWDKQFEHATKRIFHGLQKIPTIVNPAIYKERFKEAMNEIFVGI